MPRLTDTEKQEILRFIDADKPLPDKYRFLLFGDKREIVRAKNEESRSLELTSAFHECPAGRRKVAVKVVDIFGNDTMTLPEVTIGER